MDMPRWTLLLPLLFGAGPASAVGMWWNIGPMLHYEFGLQGSESGGLTFGLETSFWWEPSEKGLKFPAGLDMGMEFSSSAIRLYTEAQAGLLLGVSAGPYLEFPNTLRPDASAAYPFLGFQGSFWGWGGVGLDLRTRLSPHGSALAPGLFAKVPQCVEPCSSLFR